MRPELMYTMYLEPGDMQILNNYTMFHSRTHYEDFDAPEEKRCLFRLWLAPPDSIKMPESWKAFYRSIEPSTVRGGIRVKLMKNHMRILKNDRLTFWV